MLDALLVLACAAVAAMVGGGGEGVVRVEKEYGFHVVRVDPAEMRPRNWPSRLPGPAARTLSTTEVRASIACGPRQIESGDGGPRLVRRVTGGVVVVRLDTTFYLPARPSSALLLHEAGHALINCVNLALWRPARAVRAAAAKPVQVDVVGLDLSDKASNRAAVWSRFGDAAALGLPDSQPLHDWYDLRTGNGARLAFGSAASRVEMNEFARRLESAIPGNPRTTGPDVADGGAPRRSVSLGHVALAVLVGSAGLLALRLYRRTR